MTKCWRGNNRIYVNYPEYSEKYLIIDGQMIYVNVAIDPGCRIIGRFLKSADGGIRR